MAGEALQEIAVTVCEIRFFEFLALGVSRDQKREQLRNRCAAMPRKSITTSDIYPGLWKPVTRAMVQ